MLPPSAQLREREMTKPVDTRLENLLRASKAKIKASEADVERRAEAKWKQDEEVGRKAAHADSANWRNALEAKIGELASYRQSTGSLTLKFNTESHVIGATL